MNEYSPIAGAYGITAVTAECVSESRWTAANFMLMTVAPPAALHRKYAFPAVGSACMSTFAMVSVHSPPLPKREDVFSIA